MPTKVLKHLFGSKSLHQYEKVCYELETVFAKLSEDELKLQPQTKYLKKTLAFMWNSALWEKINFYLQGFFC